MSAVTAVSRNEILGYATIPKRREQVQMIVPKLPADVSQLNRQTETEISNVRKALDIVRQRTLSLKTQSITLVKHPKFQTIALGGGSGLVIMGPTCCFIGGGVGVAIGTAVGVVPALFTLGLSIPVGAVIGGAVGTGVGLAAGTGGGLIVGGTAGHIGHTYRVEIKNGFLHMKTTTGERVVDLRAFFVTLAQRTRSKALEITDMTRGRAISAHHLAKGQAIKLGKNTHDLIVHPKFQVTAASAAGGAAVAGAGGGAAGFVAGGAIGAAVGVLPALFTFGLSIPIGAAIGGGAGLCVGSATGATAGAVGGGATGYNVHTYRNEISSGAKSAWTTANSYASVAKAKVVGTFAATV